MRNLKIGTKLLLGFSLAVFLITLVAGIGVWRIISTEQSNEVLQHRQEIHTASLQWLRLTQVNRERDRAIAVTTNLDHRAMLQDLVVETSQQINTVEHTLRDRLYDAQDETLYQNIQNARREFLQVRDAARQAQGNGDIIRANALYESDVPRLLDSYVAQISAFADHQAKMVSETSAVTVRDGQASLPILIIVTLLALILMPLFAWLITRNLKGQLGGEPGYAAHIVERISAGDLDVDIQIGPRDRNSVLFAMTRMRANLARLVGDMQSGASSIVAAAGQITTGSLELSSRTEQQASSLAETAATMEEITATVRQNADNAQQANTLATSATQTATDGGAIVAELV